MPTLKNEWHLLLPNSTGRRNGRATDSSSSSAEEECTSADEVVPERKDTCNKVAKNRSNMFSNSSCRTNSKLRHRNHNQINRGVRGIARLLLCSLLVPMLFLTLLYLPLYANVGTRHVPHRDWTCNTSRNIADYVLPENETTLLEPRDVCQNKLFLLILVCSAAQNFVERQIIRDTWGNTAEFNYGLFARMHAHLQGQYLLPPQERLNYYSEFLHIRENQTTIPAVLPVHVLFLVGRNKEHAVTGYDIGNNALSQRLRNESAYYNDLIQEDFIDSYSNLTLKTVLALKWVSHRCLQRSAFLMKCDDDTFVNVPNLLHFLLGGTIPVYNDTFGLYDVQTYQTLSPSNRFNRTSKYLSGFAFCAARPVTNITSKWYMPYYMYPKDKYPKYLSGSAYLMSMDVVPRLYEAALSTPLIYLEDVYITGMCAAKAHVARVHQPLFGYLHSDDWCTYKGVLTQHYMYDDSAMTDAYTFVSNSQNHCPPPWPYFRRIRLRKHINNDCS